MLLVHPFRLASAIGTNIHTPDGSGDEQSLEQLLQLTTKVQGVLNVETLALGDYEDQFSVRYRRGMTSVGLRLSNGFLGEGVPVVAVVSGEVGEPEITLVDRKHGVVYIRQPVADCALSVTYSSGFTVPDDVDTEDMVHHNPRYRAAVGIPDFIETAVIQSFVQWRRNALATPAAPKEYGFLPTLNESLFGLIRASLYNHYMRPRDNLRWSESYKVL